MHILTENDYRKAISEDELLKAAYECSRSVIWKSSVAKWMHNRLQNITALRQSILDGTYQIQDYTYFRLNDPKPRIICATRFRDRVLQRSLCNNGLYDAFTSSFIYDNFACQKNKGIGVAIRRMKYHLREYFKENHTNTGWCLKLDIKQYFKSTPHDKLKEIVKKYIQEPHFQRHVVQIIDSFADSRNTAEIAADPFGERGIGLGSQCSQLLQLLYLSPLDHYIKERLQIKHYLRYMDDMILLFSSKDRAVVVLNKIKDFLKGYGLYLNKKSYLLRIEDDLQFLKVIFKLTHTGGVTTKVCRKTICKERNRIKALAEKFYNGELKALELIQHGNTWHGFARSRCSRRQIGLMKKRFMEQLVG